MEENRERDNDGVLEQEKKNIELIIEPLKQVAN